MVLNSESAETFSNFSENFSVIAQAESVSKNPSIDKAVTAFSSRLVFERHIAKTLSIMYFSRE
jgi:hypothetical protein